MFVGLSTSSLSKLKSQSRRSSCPICTAVVEPEDSFAMETPLTPVQLILFDNQKLIFLPKFQFDLVNLPYLRVEAHRLLLADATSCFQLSSHCLPASTFRLLQPSCLLASLQLPLLLPRFRGGQYDAMWAGKVTGAPLGLI